MDIRRAKMLPEFGGFEQRRKQGGVMAGRIDFDVLA